MTEPLDITLKTEIVADRNSGWACVVIEGSATMVGTGKAVRVSGTLDEVRFEATMLPVGNSSHMIPVKASVRKTLGKGIGDTVLVRLDERR